MVTSRILFTAKQKDELWERWKNGQSVLAISRALERRNKTGVQRIVALNGGIAPAPRRRAVAALKLEEREEISRGIAAGRSVRRIARGLKRSPSTISREIRRNGGSQTYRANRAERSAWERALRPKPCRLALHGELRWRVAQKLALQWSPEQISRLAEAAVPDRPRHADISRSDLSQSLCSDARRAEEGADGTVAYKAADASRQRRQGEERTGAQYSIRSLSVTDPPRPRIAQFLAIGKDDLLTGASDTHIVTLVERHSRFTMLVKLPRKDTTTVVAALAKHIRKLPQQLRRSLTWDRGKEMSDYKNFTIATKVQVYFCDPRSPWQRSTREHQRLAATVLPERARISRVSPRRTSTALPCGSINARERPWPLKPPPIDCERCCTDRLNPRSEARNVCSSPISGHQTPRLACASVARELERNLHFAAKPAGCE